MSAGNSPSVEKANPDGHPRKGRSWSQRYGDRHALKRIREFPAGIEPPKRVRIYSRNTRFLLQWWDPREHRTLNESVEGDLLDAITRARDIDSRLENFKASGRKPGRLAHTVVVERYVDDLKQRAEAGEIDVGTVRRYAASLQRHYLPFVQQPAIAKKYPHVTNVDREFRLEFTANLNRVQISPNGHVNSQRRPMKQPGFVLDVVRAMLKWAADPDRGNLLPDGFRNPFVAPRRNSRHVPSNPLSQPDITIPMARSFVEACDEFQLAVFAPLLLYGLRPGELGWIFRENIESDWLRVSCIEELDYFTKGRRDKSFPLVDCLRDLWNTESSRRAGLLLVNRSVAEGRCKVTYAGWSATQLSKEFRQRCAKGKGADALKRRRLRDQLMKAAGQLNYDHVKAEFNKISNRLHWPKQATLKDLRHLFSTSLEDAGVPEFYRRYLMGQSFGKAPIVAYTHITESAIRAHYKNALDSTLAPLVDAIERQTRALKNSSRQSESVDAADTRVATVGRAKATCREVEGCHTTCNDMAMA